MPTCRPGDGRAAIRLRHRDAIVRAARGLVEAHGPGGFTVGDVAREAQVARRTVFNHFPSVDAVLSAVYEEMLEPVVHDVLAPIAASADSDDDPATTMRTVADALAAANLPLLVHTLVGLVGDDTARVEQVRSISRAVFERVGDRILERLSPDGSPSDSPDDSPDRATEPVLALRLMVAALMHGMEVVAGQWVAETGAELTPVARDRWQGLVGQLLRQVEHGYVGAAPRSTPSPTTEPEGTTPRHG